MKLLFYRYGSIAEPDCIAGFEELGFTVLQMTEEITDKNIAGDRFVKNVSAFLDKNNVQFVFTINFFPLMAEVCRIYHLPYLCWTVDSPVMELFSDALCYETNHIFVFDRGSMELIEHRNPGHIHHLPLACNPKERREVIDRASSAQAKKFSSAISFVGSLYTEKNPYARLSATFSYMEGYFRGLIEAQRRVYGAFFLEELLTDEMTAEFKSRFHGFYESPYPGILTDRYTLANLYLGSMLTVLDRDELVKRLSEKFELALYTGSDTSSYPKAKNGGLVKSLTEMPLVFRHSKINLNTTTRPIRTGLPLRIFDILSAGGFCLTNWQNELGEELVPGVHLDTYGSMDELEEKCAWYLSHEKERQEIAENGFAYVSEHCTYPIRITRMLEMAFHV